MADATGPRQRRGQKASDAEPPSSAAAGGRAANDDVDNIEEKIARLVAEKQSTGVSVGSPMPRRERASRAAARSYSVSVSVCASSALGHTFCHFPCRRFLAPSLALAGRALLPMLAERTPRLPLSPQAPRRRLRHPRPRRLFPALLLRARAAGRRRLRSRQRHRRPQAAQGACPRAPRSRLPGRGERADACPRTGSGCRESTPLIAAPPRRRPSP